MKHIQASIFLTAAVIAAAVLPVPCHGQETYSYTVLEDGTVSLICEDHSIVRAEIPAELDGYLVTELGEGCFSDCEALEEVVIPESVTTIQSYVFQNCVMLGEVSIPASVNKIEDFVFDGCYSLENILVEDGNPVYKDDGGVLLKMGNPYTLLRYPPAKNVTSYSVPEECNTLAPWSFTDCVHLERIKLNNVGAIGADAFMGATNLRSVTLPENMKELIGASFANCRELQSVELPKNLETIGDRCFYGCISLEELTMPDTVKEIGEMAFFGCVDLKELTLPKSLRTIGEYGIGYSVDDNGDPVVIPDVNLKVYFGSNAYKYAKKQGIPFYADMPASMVMLILLGVLMVVLLFVGVYVEFSRKQQEKYAEEQRERQRRSAERKARRQKRKR